MSTDAQARVLRLWLERVARERDDERSQLAYAAASLHDSLRECPVATDAADASLVCVVMVCVLLQEGSCAMKGDAAACVECSRRTADVGVSLARWQRISGSQRALVDAFLEPFLCETCGRDGLVVRERAMKTPRS